jgi:hypothetical protein
VLLYLNLHIVKEERFLLTILRICIVQLILPKAYLQKTVRFGTRMIDGLIDHVDGVRRIRTAATYGLVVHPSGNM